MSLVVRPAYQDATVEAARAARLIEEQRRRDYSRAFLSGAWR